MMRPLYIKGQSETLVELDAPALKVRVADKAPQLFPLQRVSQVIVQGRVQWQTDALLACAKEGITVIFVDNQSVVARLLGHKGERQCVLQRLAALIAHAEGEALYRTWLRSMERMVVQSAAKRLTHEITVISTSQFQLFINEQKRNLPVQPAESVFQTMEGFLHAQVIQLCYEFGLDAESELLHEQWLDLPNDLTQLLLWDWQVPLLIWLESLSELPVYHQQVDFYHQRSQRVGKLFRGLINKLHCWLVEIH